MSIIGRRLSPEASRRAALSAARAILVEGGPQAVTLKAVAARMGRTHANLLHHFGSAAALQQALAAEIVAETGSAIASRIAAARQAGGPAEPRMIVDLFFDAFQAEGGALAAWLSLTSDAQAVAPVFAETRRLIEETAIVEPALALRAVYQLMLTALGDALMGAPLAAALGLPRDAARALAAEHLGKLLAGT